MKAAVYCGTRNLYADMIPAIKSLLHNSDVERVYLLIEDDEFPFWLPTECVCVNVSNQQWFKPDGPNFKSQWTYMVLMRAALHNLFTGMDKILSLDVDTIVTEDVSELWDISLNGYYFAGAMEPWKSFQDKLYINCGVMLVNLKELRDGKGDEIIDSLNTKFYMFNEQDCINKLCQGHLLKISSEYNSNAYTEQVSHYKIIHFACQQNWEKHPIVGVYKAMPWEEVRHG